MARASSGCLALRNSCSASLQLPVWASASPCTKTAQSWCNMGSNMNNFKACCRVKHLWHEHTTSAPPYAFQQPNECCVSIEVDAHPMCCTGYRCIIVHADLQQADLGDAGGVPCLSYPEGSSPVQLVTVHVNSFLGLASTQELLFCFTKATCSRPLSNVDCVAAGSRHYHKVFTALWLTPGSVL